MSPDADPVHSRAHERDAGAADTSGASSRLPFLVGVLLLLALAGAGAWVMLADPFGVQAAAVAPPPAADNLLGQAWSFETTDTGSPEQAWMMAPGAPSGFSFGAQSARSGAAGAHAATGDGGWAAILLREALRLPGSERLLEYSAHSDSEALALVLRFEAPGRPPLDIVVASGAGAITGRCRPPPGFQTVRPGLAAAGPGGADDLVLSALSAGASDPAPQTLGVYETRLLAGHTLAVSRGQDVVLAVLPPAFRPAEGRVLPPGLSWLAGQDALALADGSRVGASLAVDQEPGRLALRWELAQPPAGATLVASAVLSGDLAARPVGVRAAGRYDRFADDFRVEGADALVLGSTNDRIMLELPVPAVISASAADDGSIVFQIEWPAAAGVHALSIRAGFQAERVEAASLLERAARQEADGQSGATLALLERIVTEFPYDEQVLADASVARAALNAAADAELRTLAAALDDAVFLGNAGRCRDVQSAAQRAGAAWAGSSGPSAALAQLAAEIERRAGPVLAERDDRQRLALAARLESFREDGRFPSVVAELEAALAALQAGGGAP